MVYARAPGKPTCQYGSSCYRKNLQHWQQFDHPADHAFLTPPVRPPTDPSAVASAVARTTADSDCQADAPETKRQRVDDGEATESEGNDTEDEAADNTSLGGVPPEGMDDDATQEDELLVDGEPAVGALAMDHPVAAAAGCGEAEVDDATPISAVAATYDPREMRSGIDALLDELFDSPAPAPAADAPTLTPVSPPIPAAALAPAAAPVAPPATIAAPATATAAAIAAPEAPAAPFVAPATPASPIVAPAPATPVVAPVASAAPTAPAVAPLAAVPTTAPTGDGQDALGPLTDGESKEVQGSGANTYTLKRTGGVYTCTCPAWRNQRGGTMRTCKHLKGIRGEDSERARLGGDDKVFYATGKRVAGGDSSTVPARGGASSANHAIEAGVALAQSWDEKSSHDGWLLSEKLDGQRCIWDGQGGLWTRTGNEIYAPRALLGALPHGTMLDGELWLGRGRFQELMTITRRQDRPASWGAVTFMVFDAPKAAGGIVVRLQAAKDALGAHAAATGGPGMVRVLEHVACRGINHIREHLRDVEAAGGEGVMLRHPTAGHRAGRTSDVLKVKSRRDDEALVIGHEDGKGKHAGRLGALLCRLRSGQTFKVGTGFKDEDRENPPKLGSVITFQYAELTNDNRPRFPSFQRVRPDVDKREFPGAASFP